MSAVMTPPEVIEPTLPGAMPVWADPEHQTSPWSESFSVVAGVDDEDPDEAYFLDDDEDEDDEGYDDDEGDLDDDLEDDFEDDRDEDDESDEL